MDWLIPIKESLKKALIIKIQSYGAAYDYVVNPLSSGTPELSANALLGCAFEISRVANLDGVTKILTPEAMGIHIGAVLTLITGIPLLIIRKRKHGLPNEIEVIKRTGYAESRMYINGVNKNDRVILVDSIIATGGTYSALIKALKEHGVLVQDAIAVIERTELKGVERVKNETGINVKTLIKTKLENGKLIIL
ncbi:MAG: adenine phosphoribosyltransferase [Candidatus Bathyarchaeia archaeon]